MISRQLIQEELWPPLAQKQLSRASSPDAGLETDILDDLEKGFQKLSQIRDRLAPKNPLPAACQWVFDEHVFLVHHVFVGWTWAIMGITTEGWAWYGTTFVTSQIQHWKDEPYSRLVVRPTSGENPQPSWCGTSIPWLLRLNNHHVCADRGPARGPLMTLDMIVNQVRNS